MKNILIFSTASGFCHKSTSDAIELILDDIDVNIEIVEFYDCFGKFKIPFSSKQYSVPEIYNKYIQQKGNTGLLWIFSSIFFILILKLRVKGINNKLDNLLVKKRPDMVISLIPLVNKILCKSISAYSQGLKLHTIVVDFCQPFPRIWIQSKNQVVYGWNKKLLRQTRRFGIPPSNIVNLEGQLISPILNKINKTKQNSTFVVFVIWGGNGSKRMLKYAQQLEKTDNRIEIHYVIGPNENFDFSLNKLLKKNNSKIHTFFADVTEIYTKANIVLGKPGPGIISESILTNTPLLLELNSKTLIQERYNAKWAKAAGVALLFKNSKELIIKLPKIVFEYKTYEEMKQNTKKFKNNSIEIFKKSVIETIY